MFAPARRNRIDIPFASVEAVGAAYSFAKLQDVLDIHYRGADVLRTEEDSAIAPPLTAWSMPRSSSIRRRTSRAAWRSPS